ncbi:MAG: hypothetical protein ACRDZ3_03600 [Acidimicrobiia bacterium]
MPFQLDNEAVLYAWFAREQDPEIRLKVLTWIGDVLLADPQAVEATPIPGVRAAVVGTFVPRTDVFITYLIGHPHRVVRLLSVSSLGDLLP